MKRFLATAVTAAILASGGVAVAGAAQSSNKSAATSSTTTAPDASANTKATPRQRRARLHLLGVGVKAAADSLHMTVPELRSALRGGHTIADVAKAHDVEPATVEAAMNRALDKLVDQAVSNGKIDASRATQLKQRIADRVTKFVEQTPKAVGHQGPRAQFINVAAKTIGISPSDLLTALKNGQSVADVATAHNVSPQTVTDAIVKAGTTRLEKVVDHFVHATRNGAGAAASTSTTSGA